MITTRMLVEPSNGKVQSTRRFRKATKYCQNLTQNKFIEKIDEI